MPARDNEIDAHDFILHSFTDWLDDVEELNERRRLCYVEAFRDSPGSTQDVPDVFKAT